MRVRARFILACTFAVALVLSAPFIGQIRSALRTAFPGHFVRIVAGAVGAAVAAAIVVALVRIRDRRARRYAALAAALAIGVGYAMLTRTGRPEVDAVERFHFIEYGLVTFLFYRAWRHLEDAAIFILPIVAGLIVGTFEEWLQWFVPVRVGEVKDIFLNGVAIGCGLLVSYAIDPPPRIAMSVSRQSAARIALLSSLAVLVFASFFHVVHLGYDVTDASTGTFRSRYDALALLEHAASRAVQWKEHPPLKLVRVSREDQYMTEGVVHVQRRNEAWGEGNFTAAWFENLILEKYFAPVLDTPSFLSPSGHRWPDAQRADAQARAATASAGNYVSDAYPYQLYVWPRVIYWTLALLTAAAVATPALRRRDRSQRPALVA
jgi:hypothetical protein